MLRGLTTVSGEPPGESATPPPGLNRPRSHVSRTRSMAPAVLVVTGVLLAGCGAAPAQPLGTGTADPVTGEVTVFAAASLTESFTRLAGQFQAAHPGVRVVFSFGPSSGLAAQVNAGAPADVFASASQQNMDQVVTAGGASDVRTFARNVMQVVVPAANPGNVRTLADLGRRDVTVAVCQPAVPCGVGAARVFANAKLAVTPVSQETDVKGVLTKVRLGEVDAGVVYATDVVTGGGSVTGVPIPADLNASTAYPLTVLKDGTNRTAGRAFADYVLSPAGAAVLVEDGFETP